MPVLRPNWLGLTLLLMAAPLPAPGQYPGPVSGWLSTARHRRPRHTLPAPPQEGRAASPTDSTSGMLRRIRKDEVVLEADDHRILSFKRTSATHFLKMGNPIKTTDLEPGDFVEIESSEDDEGFMTAVNVLWQQDGTAKDRAHAIEPVQTSMAKSAKERATDSDKDTAGDKENAKDSAKKEAKDSANDAAAPPPAPSGAQPTAQSAAAAPPAPARAEEPNPADLNAPVKEDVKVGPDRPGRSRSPRCCAEAAVSPIRKRNPRRRPAPRPPRPLPNSRPQTSRPPRIRAAGDRTAAPRRGHHRKGAPGRRQFPRKSAQLLLPGSHDPLPERLPTPRTGSRSTSFPWR